MAAATLKYLSRRQVEANGALEIGLAVIGLGSRAGRHGEWTKATVEKEAET